MTGLGPGPHDFAEHTHRPAAGRASDAGVDGGAEPLVRHPAGPQALPWLVSGAPFGDHGAAWRNGPTLWTRCGTHASACRIRPVIPCWASLYQRAEWPPQADGDEIVAAVRDGWERIRPFSTGGDYVNFQLAEEDAQNRRRLPLSAPPAGQGAVRPGQRVPRQPQHQSARMRSASSGTLAIPAAVPPGCADSKFL